MNNTKFNNKIYVLFTVLFFLIIQSCNDLPEENDLKKKNLNGNVYYCSTRSYNVLNKFGELSKNGFPNFNWQSDDIFFNSEGYIIKSTDIDKNGLNSYLSLNSYENNNIISSERFSQDLSPSYKTKFSYDDNGNCTKKSGFDENGEVKYVVKYIFEENNCIKETRFNKEGNIKYVKKFKYEKNNKIEETKYDDKGFIKSRYENKYYSNGIIKEAKSFSEDGELYFHKYYDKSGYGLKTIYYKDNEIDYIWKYLKDEFGNTIQSTKNDENDLEVLKYTYDFEYDNKNNWIKKTTFRNEVPDRIIEREIKYSDDLESNSDYMFLLSNSNKLDSSNFYLRLAEKNIGNKNLIDAEKNIDDGFKLNKNSSLAHYLLGRLNEEKEAFDKAISNYKNAIKLNPFYAFAIGDLAYLYMTEKNEYEKSIEYYSKLIEFDVSNSNTGNYYFRGMAKFYNEDYNEAIEDFSKRLEYKDDHYYSYYYRGAAKSNLDIDYCDDLKKSCDLGFSKGCDNYTKLCK